MAGVRSSRRQRAAAEFVLPSWMAPRVRRRHPDVDVGLACRALRQWLRIHPLVPGRLGMPSIVVEKMWADLRRDPAVIEDFAGRAYPYRTRRSEARTAEVQSSTRRDGDLALTFALACRDEGLARYQSHLPALFAVDDPLAGRGARRWVLRCGRSTCRTAPGVRCVKHDLVELIPADLPRQVPYRQPASYPPVNMDEHLRFGHNSGGTFSGCSGG